MNLVVNEKINIQILDYNTVSKVCARYDKRGELGENHEVLKELEKRCESSVRVGHKMCKN